VAIDRWNKRHGRSISRRRIVGRCKPSRAWNICDVLRNAGFMDTLQAGNSDELPQLVEQVGYELS
jgi:hypothetical protein